MGCCSRPLGYLLDFQKLFDLFSGFSCKVSISYGVLNEKYFGDEVLAIRIGINQVICIQLAFKAPMFFKNSATPWA